MRGAAVRVTVAETTYDGFTGRTGKGKRMGSGSREGAEGGRFFSPTKVPLQLVGEELVPVGLFVAGRARPVRGSHPAGQLTDICWLHVLRPWRRLGSMQCDKTGLLTM